MCHVGVGWVMLWWVGNGGVCHAGVGGSSRSEVGSCRGGVGHVGWGWSCRGGVGWVM